jgi:hypothetical protein
MRIDHLDVRNSARKLDGAVHVELGREGVMRGRRLCRESKRESGDKRCAPRAACRRSGT